MRAIGYLRVSTAEQGESKAGLESQERLVRDEATRRGWDLTLRTDVASGKSVRGRGELGQALRDLRDGNAEVLVVAKLDRLSRSVLDFANLMDLAVKEGWSIVVLDLNVDMTTTNGRLISHIMIALAQWERELIGDRTRAGLKAVRARGTKVGRKPGVTPATLRLIVGLRTSGLSWQRIADTLTAQGVPTAQGGRWHASTIRKLHTSQETAA